MNKAITTIVHNSLLNHKRKKILSFVYDEEFSNINHDIYILNSFNKDKNDYPNKFVLKDISQFDYFHYIITAYGIAQNESNKISMSLNANIISVFVGEISDNITKRQKQFINKTCGHFNIVQKNKDKEHFDNQNRVYSLEENTSVSSLINNIISQNKVYNSI